MRRGERTGQYTLLRPVGSGGQAETWLAYDEEARAPRCLKFGFRGQTRAIEGEFEALIRISDPGVAKVSDTGLAFDRAYIASEWVDGRSLRELLDHHAPLPMHIAAGIFVDIMSALAAGHAQDVCHHDLKPANVMLDAGGGVRLIDYGSARVLGETVGKGLTLGYAAPEQVLAGKYKEPAGPAADWFAAGVVLFEMLCGERPYDATSPRSFIAAATAAHPPKLPGERAALCAPLLAFDPTKRNPEQALARCSHVMDRLGWRAELVELLDDVETTTRNRAAAAEVRPVVRALRAAGLVLVGALSAVALGMTWVPFATPPPSVAASTQVPAAGASPPTTPTDTDDSLRPQLTVASSRPVAAPAEVPSSANSDDTSPHEEEDHATTPGRPRAVNDANPRRRRRHTGRPRRRPEEPPAGTIYEPPPSPGEQRHLDALRRYGIFSE